MYGKYIIKKTVSLSYCITAVVINILTQVLKVYEKRFITRVTGSYPVHLKAVNRFTFGFSTQVSTAFPSKYRTCPLYQPSRFAKLWF